MDYINVKYKDKFEALGIPETGFTSVDFKMEMQTIITNRSIGRFLREENKYQKILIYACLVNTSPVCYALVRVPEGDEIYAINDPRLRYMPNSNQPFPLTDAEKSKIPILGMDTKILFIFPGRSNFTSVDITDSTAEDKDITAAVKDSMQVFKNNMMDKCKKKLQDTDISAEVKKIIMVEYEKLQKLTEANYRQMSKLCEFQSFISSNGDKYRIFLSKKMHINLDILLTLPTISEKDPQYAVSSDAVSSHAVSSHDVSSDAVSN